MTEEFTVPHITEALDLDSGKPIAELLAEAMDRNISRKIAEGIIKVGRGESKPYRFGRTNNQGDSPRYRADMIDAGRGRLLR